MYLKLSFFVGAMKVPLRDLASYWVEQHSRECNPEEPICLGLLDDIDIEDKGNHRIWVENGQVFLHVRCPESLHERIIVELVIALHEACVKAGIRESVQQSGSTTMHVENQLGCHTKFKKEPDVSLSISDEYIGSQEYPVFASEVAVHHESLPRLLCEGSTWLNSRTDMVFCLLIKIYPASRRIRIFLLGRTVPLGDAVFPTPIEESGDENIDSRAVRALAETLAKKATPRYCIGYDPNDLQSRERIKEKYQVQVLNDILIGPKDNPINVTLTMDLAQLAGRSNAPCGDRIGEMLVINMDRIIRLARAEIEKYLGKRGAADPEGAEGGGRRCCRSFSAS